MLFIHGYFVDMQLQNKAFRRRMIVHSQKPWFINWFLSQLIGTKHPINRWCSIRTSFSNRKILTFTVWQRLWHRPRHWVGSVLRKNVRQRWKPFLSEEHKTYTNLGWNSVTDFWLIMSLMNLAGSFYAGAKPLVSVTIRPLILIPFDMIFYPMAIYIIFIELIYWTNTSCQFFQP